MYIYIYSLNFLDKLKIYIFFSLFEFLIDHKEEQEQELEVLQSIYPDEFEGKEKNNFFFSIILSRKISSIMLNIKKSKSIFTFFFFKKKKRNFGRRISYSN
jgi:hypothetical protein